MTVGPKTPTDKRDPGWSAQPSRRVLLVSNDRESGEIWAYALRQMGLQVTLAASAADAVARWEQDTFDLILIDVCGPDLDGIELAHRFRSVAVNPVLLFTTHCDEAYVVTAYGAGVDECVIKPLSPSLFLAKVRAWLRRAWMVPATALASFQAGPLRLDPARRAVLLADGTVVRLTNLEFRLLHLLMSHPGQPLAADVIVERVWGYSGGDSVVLKNLVYRLRHKIEPDQSQPRYIQTAPGGGYLFVL